MKITELLETIDGDKCITFYHYDPRSNTKHYSSTFVITPRFNKLRIKKNFEKELKKALANLVVPVPLRPIMLN